MVAAGRLPLYLSSYAEAERTEYGEALQEAQKQLSYRRIIDFVCSAIIASSEEESVIQQTLQSLPEVWQKRGGFRRESSAARSLELLLRMPILTIKLLADELEHAQKVRVQAFQIIHNGRPGAFADDRTTSFEDVISVIAPLQRSFHKAQKRSSTGSADPSPGRCC